MIQIYDNLFYNQGNLYVFTILYTIPSFLSTYNNICEFIRQYGHAFIDFFNHSNPQFLHTDTCLHSEYTNFASSE